MDARLLAALVLLAAFGQVNTRGRASRLEAEPPGLFPAAAGLREDQRGVQRSLVLKLRCRPTGAWALPCDPAAHRRGALFAALHSLGQHRQLCRGSAVYTRARLPEDAGCGWRVDGSATVLRKPCAPPLLPVPPLQAQGVCTLTNSAGIIPQVVASGLSGTATLEFDTGNGMKYSAVNTCPDRYHAGVNISTGGSARYMGMVVLELGMECVCGAAEGRRLGRPRRGAITVATAGATPRPPSLPRSLPSRSAPPGSAFAVTLCGTTPSTLDTRLFVGYGCPTSWSPFHCWAAADNTTGLSAGGCPGSLSALVTNIVGDAANRDHYYAMVSLPVNSGIVSVQVSYFFTLTTPTSTPTASATMSATGSATNTPSPSSSPSVSPSPSVTPTRTPP
jgi:hypothetical protein